MQKELVNIRAAKADELEEIYSLVTLNDEWTKFNGPYFTYTHPSQSDFAEMKFKMLLDGVDMQLITLDNKPIGTVNCYWECKETRWLEAGVIIYDSDYWGQNIGALAVPLWITNLFNTREIERVGMTTWSGNSRMMALAEKVGLKREAILRKVRYYKGKYYDSVKYGVIREEWENRN